MFPSVSTGALCNILTSLYDGQNFPSSQNYLHSPTSFFFIFLFVRRIISQKEGEIASIFCIEVIAVCQ